MEDTAVAVALAMYLDALPARQLSPLSHIAALLRPLLLELGSEVVRQIKLEVLI